MCSPGGLAIVLGSLAVVAGLTMAAYATYFGVGRRNPLWILEALGSAAFVVGIVGQRAYYLSAEQVAAGCSKTVSPHPGPWDASVTVPLFSLHLSYLSIIGVFVMVLGFCLMMFFEPQRPNTAAVQVVEPGEVS
jgi:hypothetical protein